MFGTHPYLQPHGEPYAPHARTAIQGAVQTLGFEYVNGQAFEWTRWSSVDTVRSISGFADAMQHEVMARIHHAQMREQARRAAEAAAAAEKERRRLARRNQATTALLLD